MADLACGTCGTPTTTSAKFCAECGQAVPQVVQPDAPPAPTGWYPDPQGGVGERFWDGAKWTNQVKFTTKPPQSPDARPAWWLPHEHPRPQDSTPTSMGYYPDPDDPGKRRFWNGSGWTGTTPVDLPKPVRPRSNQWSDSKVFFIVGGGVLAGVALLGLVSNLLGEDSEPSRSTTPSFTGEVLAASPLNPATMRVVAQVTNTGNTAGTPACTIRVSDPGGSYSGFDIFTAKNPLGAGDSLKFQGDIVIKNEGAGYVTETTIKCEES